jgi:TRAP-type transport system periplasmic protein
MKRTCLTMIIAVFLIVLSGALSAIPATAENPIELKLATWAPPTHPVNAIAFKSFVAEVEERTHGKVKITIFAGGTLGAPKDHLDLALDGVADIAVTITGYTAGRLPLTDVMSLPIERSSAQTGTRVLWELYPLYLKQEFSKVKLLAFYTQEPMQFLMTSKRINNLADMLKGAKIRNGAPSHIPILREWGAAALNLSITDTYDAIQKGMADGVWTGTSALLDFNLIDVTKSVAIVNSTAPIAIMVMNLKRWNSLPPDVQKVIDDASGLKLWLKCAEVFDNRAKEALEATKARGNQIYELTAEEKKIWAEKAGLVCEPWVADMEKKGLPGRKVYQDAMELARKFSKQ